MIRDISLPFNAYERKVFEGLLKAPGDVFIPAFQSQSCGLVADHSGMMGPYSSLLVHCPILADSEGHKMDQLLFGLGRNYLLQHAVPKGYLKYKSAHTCPDLLQT